MRMYDIAFAIFLFNISLSILANIGITDIVNGGGMEPLEDDFSSGANADAARDYASSAITRTDSGLAASTINWLIENVRLMVASATAFTKMLLGATVAFPVLLRGLGVPSEIYIPLSGVIYFVYAAGIVQYIGKGFREQQ